MSTLTNLETFLEKYPAESGTRINYGTSGFRHKADKLSHIAFRVGIFAVLRARYKKAIIGAIITASHNPEEDNGIKFIDPMGEMLEDSWESLVTDLANVPDDQVDKTVQALIARFGIDMATDGIVYVGRDTRKSSPTLCEALLAGIKVANGTSIDFGLLTTPQLHYIVRSKNTNGQYGEPTEDGYYQKLSNAFLRLNQLIGNNPNYKPHLVVDGANGIGALQLTKFSKFIGDKLTFEIVHEPQGILNYQCGADFVKVNQREPKSIVLKVDQRYASFDGDADRIIYYYKNSKDDKFHMLDGDKIAVLVAKYLKETLAAAAFDDIAVSIVQTAYANGSSTIYMREVLNMETFCVPTGVKHLHHKAGQCQVGVYFEANGHGTILFSEDVERRIKQSTNPKAIQLSHFIDLVNQTVGDAISDMLVVETILNSLNITIEDWDSLYNDLPNRLLKQEVVDRNVITTTDAERRCVLPSGLQAAIDETVGHFGSKARSFVRPSGTEDVVRIFAEAQSQTDADLLAKKVANLVFDFANGVGQKHQL
ncbi:hypothetical protein RDWZM_000714 [Blomia tropicalis]|uniref:Phosphoacetylglucosamine mutase n=1 Tax=Blomia tropicalis TaxID=40697 RepID=A0A9Q0MB36_BLOTA|nr:hypothetical protein RDWZM_000714 [Blomia tropicalis]